MWVEAVSFLLKSVDLGDCAGVSFPCHTPPKMPRLRSFPCTVLQSHRISCSSLAPILLPPPAVTALLTSTYSLHWSLPFSALHLLLDCCTAPYAWNLSPALKLLVTSLPHHSPFQLFPLFPIIFCLHQSLTCSLFTCIRLQPPQGRFEWCRLEFDCSGLSTQSY